MFSLSQYFIISHHFSHFHPLPSPQKSPDLQIILHKYHIQTNYSQNITLTIETHSAPSHHHHHISSLLLVTCANHNTIDTTTHRALISFLSHYTIRSEHSQNHQNTLSQDDAKCVPRVSTPLCKGQIWC